MGKHKKKSFIRYFKWKGKSIQDKLVFLVIVYIGIVSLVGAGYYIKGQLNRAVSFNEIIVQHLISQPDLITDISSALPTEQDHPDVSGNKQSDPPTEETPAKGKIPAVSKADQLKVMAIIGRKLTPGDYRYIMSLIQQPITPEKIAEIKQLLTQRLGEDDYQQLIAVAKKYL